MRWCLLDTTGGYSHELSTVVFAYTRPAQDQLRPYLSTDGECAHQTPLLVEMLALQGESWLSSGETFGSLSTLRWAALHPQESKQH